MASTQPIKAEQSVVVTESVAGVQLFNMESEILKATQVQRNGAVNTLRS